MSGWTENLKVHYDRPDDEVPVREAITRWTPERTAPQKHADHALEQAAKAAAEAMKLTEEAVAWLGSVNGGQVTNSTAPVYVNKLIEEIAEVRRVRG